MDAVELVLLVTETDPAGALERDNGVGKWSCDAEESEEKTGVMEETVEVEKLLEITALVCWTRGTMKVTRRILCWVNRVWYAATIGFKSSDNAWTLA